MQPGGFLGRFIGPLLKTGLPTMKNELKPLAKSVLIPLELTGASAKDVAIQKKIYGSGVRPLDLEKRTTLIMLNEEIKDIVKIVEESGLSKKVVSETIKNEQLKMSKRAKRWISQRVIRYIRC